MDVLSRVWAGTFPKPCKILTRISDNRCPSLLFHIIPRNIAFCRGIFLKCLGCPNRIICHPLCGCPPSLSLSAKGTTVGAKGTFKARSSSWFGSCARSGSHKKRGLEIWRFQGQSKNQSDVIRCQDEGHERNSVLGRMVGSFGAAEGGGWVGGLLSLPLMTHTHACRHLPRRPACAPRARSSSPQGGPRSEFSGGAIVTSGVAHRHKPTQRQKQVNTFACNRFFLVPFSPKLTISENLRMHVLSVDHLLPP